MDVCTSYSQTPCINFENFQHFEDMEKIQNYHLPARQWVQGEQIMSCFKHIVIKLFADI